MVRGCPSRSVSLNGSPAPALTVDEPASQREQRYGNTQKLLQPHFDSPHGPVIGRLAVQIVNSALDRNPFALERYMPLRSL